MKNRNKKKIRFLKELEVNPIVARACRKVGVSRSTYYRWLAEDDEFRELAESSKERGLDKMNDFAESKLLENVSSNLHQAITYWLSNNSKRYQRPTTILHFRENERLSSMLKSQQEIINWLTNIIGEDKVIRMMGNGSLDTFLQRARKDKDIDMN